MSSGSNSGGIDAVEYAPGAGITRNPDMNGIQSGDISVERFISRNP